MDGFGAGAGYFKNYEYKTGEIMVLELADNIRKNMLGRNKESDVRSLKGHLKVNDFGTGITSSSASYQKALKREQKRQAIRHRNQIKRDAAVRAQIYVPQTPETALSYEEITAIISDLVGGVPDDILHQTAYELLRLLKAEGITDTQRTSGIDQQLCVKVPPETVARLFTLAADLTDFTVNASVNLNEADEDGIVTIGNEPDDEELLSSSSDDEENAEDAGTVAPPTVGTGGWDVARLTELLKTEFEDEWETKLEIILKLLQNESGSKLETEIARVFKFKHLDVVATIIKNKDFIIKTEKNETDDLKRIDLSRYIFEEGGHFLSNTNATLPIGTETIDTDTYREISVPYDKTPTEEPLFQVADLPEFARLAFSSFTTLNKVQSALWETAMKTDKNLLVAAPTGAGKTNIALLCMLREFEIRPKAKVVYVAPMKSLVQEMVGSFAYRLCPYAKKVVELTGDSSASKAQLSNADVIVTTPEKWDIITRKVGSRILTEMVSLFIIDEIHLLHDERGPVLEALVSRMKRTVDTTRQQLRFVGLSATMPNYEDIALFLRVESDGLFVFDERYRPCPLSKMFIGVRNKSGLAAKREMNEICYRKVVERVEQSQILVFVHSRRETSETVRYFIEKANDEGNSNLFANPNTMTADILTDSVEKAHNSVLKEVITSGFAFHNAGLDADDRKLVESLFSKGYIKVLVSTATLAWGVNLPAHTVIIKGTRVYNPEQSRWENLSYLDVLQMFGRAGRPQFDTNGEGIIITEMRELQFYVSVLNQQMPIESHFLRDVASHLNAEISLGTITSLNDAAEWIGFTFLFVRMMRSPILYQVEDNENDPSLRHRRLEIVHSAAMLLDEKRLIRYDQKTGELRPTDIGRIAADFYISPDTMQKFAQFLRPNMTDSDIFRLFCVSSEFKNISVRPEEKSEVSKLINHVPIPIKEPSDDPVAKINVLLQCYICRSSLKGFSLMADMIYISQNAERIMRCMYEIALSMGWAELSLNLLNYAKMVGARMWNVQSPLRQFKEVPTSIVGQLERKYFPWGRYFDLTPARLGEMAKSPKDGEFLADTIKKFPRLKITARKLPLNKNFIKFNLDVQADFVYDPEVHHATEPFWVFVSDCNFTKILHSELFLLKSKHPQTTLSFIVTLIEPIQPFYFIKVISDRWIPCETDITVSLGDIVNIDKHQRMLRPTADSDPFLEVVHAASTNPDKSVLIAAPINSGRSSCCTRIIEDAISKGQKIAVIVPSFDKFKRTSTEYAQKYGFISLTGDPDSDNHIIQNERLIVGTHSMFITLGSFDTIFLNDLHLIGDESFADYEAFISILINTSFSFRRLIAVSAPIANAKSITQWLNIEEKFSFVFSPLMRDIQFQIQTFNFPTSKARLMAMSRPLFSSVRTASTSIVFVPSISQLHLTAFELINFASLGQEKNVFLRKPDGEVKDDMFSNKILNDVAKYGIALFYPSLSQNDKETILANFGTVFGCIVALVDSVWELNMSAEVVAMKGTDIYDGTTHQHIEYPIVLVMEAMGYALDGGKFVLFTHTPRKRYYISFLSEPMTIESSFDLVVQEAFIISMSMGITLSKQSLVEFVTHTLFFQRLCFNPSYYGLEVDKAAFVDDSQYKSIILGSYVSELIDNTIEELSRINMIALDELEIKNENGEAETTNEIASEIPNLCFISANHHIDPATTDLISRAITSDTAHKKIIQIVCASSEIAMIPLRSPKTVAELLKRFPDVLGEVDDPSTFATLLIRSHLARLPIPDDSLDVFRQICTAFLKVIGATIDISAEERHFLKPTIGAIQLLQRVVQGVGFGMSDLLQIPLISEQNAFAFADKNVNTIDNLRDVGAEEGGEELCKKIIGIASGSEEDERKWQLICESVNIYPSVAVTATMETVTSTREVVEANEDENEASTVTNNITITTATVKVVLERDIDEDETVSHLVHAPRFPIRKTENWFVILADINDNIIGIQKTSLERVDEIVFDDAPTGAPLRVFVLCDSYIGCDRACDVVIA